MNEDMLIAIAFTLTLLLAALVARGGWALHRQLEPQRNRRGLDPFDVDEIAFTLDDVATRYRGFNRSAATRELSRLLQRRARRGYHVVMASTETCDTLGRSTFVVLQDGSVIRLDAPEASVDGEPWALTSNPEDVILGARIEGADFDEHGLMVGLRDQDRLIRLRAHGGAYVGAQA